MLTAVDLFCGAGGLTEGLKQAGFTVLGAVESAPLASDAYKSNHPATLVLQRDIRRVSPVDLMDQVGLKRGELDLLAGCPPCQGFSTMRTHRRGTNVADPRNRLVAQFARFAEALYPRTLMMENVPALRDDRRFKLMLARLTALGYTLSEAVLDAADFGVPQRRRRLVVLGCRGAKVNFAQPSEVRQSVRDSLAALPPPASSEDPLHNHGERRSQEIQELIRAIPPDGGSRRALGPERQLACHGRTNGWFDVYGRMAWDDVAPTITSGCINPSKGRFLHPEQHRAISLREAALLQAFPPDYFFPLTGGKYRAADLIGNALPPRFVARHAEQLVSALGSA